MVGSTVLPWFRGMAKFAHAEINVDPGRPPQHSLAHNEGIINCWQSQLDITNRFLKSHSTSHCGLPSCYCLIQSNSWLIQKQARWWNACLLKTIKLAKANKIGYCSVQDFPTIYWICLQLSDRAPQSAGVCPSTLVCSIINCTASHIICTIFGTNSTNTVRSKWSLDSLWPCHLLWITLGLNII